MSELPRVDAEVFFWENGIVVCVYPGEVWITHRLIPNLLWKRIDVGPVQYV